MAIKNRATLKQQYNDYINRVAPFDGNPLIQNTGDLQVNDDFIDSALTKDDNSDLINSPGDLINLDFAAIDLHRINSSGSVETIFTITLANIGTGQIGRIHITKKTNDTYDFSNATIGNISNLNQSGTSLMFYVTNVNGVLFAESNITIPKSDSITSSSTDQLATSKAVLDAKNNRSAKDQGAFTSVTENVDLGSFNKINYNVKVRLTDQGMIQMTGFAEYQQPAAAPSLISLGLIPLSFRPNRDMVIPIAGENSGGEVTILSTGIIVGLSPGNASTGFYYFDPIQFVKTA